MIRSCPESELTLVTVHTGLVPDVRGGDGPGLGASIPAGVTADDCEYRYSENDDAESDPEHSIAHGGIREETVEENRKRKIT